jgi:EAL domain-containing protein (putative c-di-GMP-specific phosphodiesterase class I)
MVQQDVESAVKTMRALRALGIRIVLDDVGTTGSNLNYLRGLPLDAVKLDRRFLRALNTDPQARALVEAILAAAHAVGLDVVGEGVETPEQLALLRHLGCRWVQGYFLGRPVSGEETRQWIRHMPARTVDAEEAVDLTVRA